MLKSLNTKEKKEKEEKEKEEKEKRTNLKRPPPYGRGLMFENGCK